MCCISRKEIRKERGKRSRERDMGLWISNGRKSVSTPILHFEIFTQQMNIKKYYKHCTPPKILKIFYNIPKTFTKHIVKSICSGDYMVYGLEYI